MRKVAAPVLVILALLLSSSCAYANPVPSFEEQMYPFYWLIKTLPFNYTVDLISLFLALLVFGQNQSIAWKMAPVYNLVVVAAGYTSDWGARVISGFPAYAPSAKDPIVGIMVASENYNLLNMNDFTLARGVGFILAAALLIYLFNLVIIHVILRLNDVESRGRLHLAAMVMALVTSPYIALRGDSKPACVAPVLLAVSSLATFALIRRFIGKRKTAVR